ncbi:MAG: hypothetical protein ACHP7N_16120, partial [Caulobacterales bacterium]
RRYFISARDGARICLLAQLAAPGGRIVIPRFDPASGAIELAETAERFLRQRGRRAVFVGTPEEAAARLASAGEDYPVLLTPRDTAGEKDVEVFQGAGESAEGIGLTALEALAPAPVDPAALAGVLAELEAFVAGEQPTPTAAELEAILRCVIPNFAHLAGEETLDDRI